MKKKIRLPKHLNNEMKKGGKCILCGKPTEYHHLYCPKHWKMIDKIKPIRL